MRVRHFTTTEAVPGELIAIRTVIDRAFDGAFTVDDWEHSVGGWHVVAVERSAIVAHASVVGRTLEIDNASFDTGYVEAVATDPDRQGLGFGTAVMRTAAKLIEAHHQLGALSTGEHLFYERIGWERWQGPTLVRAGGELIRTPDEDDGIMVMRFGSSTGVDLSAPIVCEVRPGDIW
ncbi:MAG: GNAT family N-acetyltransferase [Acidimicrobiia bacterium]|nr:GNAT family N-acetyltransferase [Acidimicrobiia bacterium]